MTDTITIPQVTDSGAVRGMMYALRGRYRFLDTIPIGRSVLGREIFGLRLGGTLLGVAQRRGDEIKVRTWLAE